MFEDLPRGVKHDQGCVEGLQLAVEVGIAQFDNISLYESHEGNQQKDFEHVPPDDSRIQVLTSRAES